ncbi:hypothetical protein BCF53_10618 [Reinekea marinisedimentorum]|uniref:Uncharacterized protein n=1 Tax=Reinekea marinisedimentorum TaxID=230495 RepID=A0A4R3I5L4_9GAMM|nr:hypothetical protein BCF53_10618 [Reinekea marinisedimentorum]
MLFLNYFMRVWLHSIIFSINEMYVSMMAIISVATQFLLIFAFENF